MIRLELATLFTPLLPSSIFTAEIIGEPPLPALQPAEAEALGRAGSKRLRDFTKGRACARRALFAFGFEATPVLIGHDGAPLWPRGFVGSITHCQGYCVAAVGREAEFQALGVDAEPLAALPPGVLDLVASPSERSWLRGQEGSPFSWDRILFSAKESAFKAGARVLGRPLPFNEIEIAFDRNAGAFEANLSAVRRVPRLRGRFRVASGLIATTVIIPA